MLTVEPLLALFLSDAERAAGMAGAAREDVIGYGFWWPWLVLSAIQFVVLASLWLQQNARTAAMVLAVIFLAASALAYFEHREALLIWNEQYGV